MCQRAFVDYPRKKIPSDSAHWDLAVFYQFIEFITTCISATICMGFDQFRGDAPRLNSRSVNPSRFHGRFSTVRLGLFRGAFTRSNSTIHVVNSRLLPLLSLLRSSVSMIPDKHRQRFLLWSVELKEALEAIRSIRPTRKNSFGKIRVTLLDRNHFLVLVNGRSPP